MSSGWIKKTYANKNTFARHQTSQVLKDRIINTQGKGKEISDLCISGRMRIANGRLPCDRRENWHFNILHTVKL